MHNSMSLTGELVRQNEILRALLDPSPVECDGGSGWAEVFVYDEPEGER